LPDTGVQPKRPGNGHGRILLVEDYASLARLLSLALSAEGYEVHVAGAKAEAQCLAREHAFDLVISDLHLPDGSGCDLMRELKAAGLRGIALSGSGDPEDVQRSQTAGFSEHLVKPLEPDELYAAVQRVLQQRVS
jgi:DNA-binding response OmpR family regulator